MVNNWWISFSKYLFGEKVMNDTHIFRENFMVSLNTVEMLEKFRRFNRYILPKFLAILLNLV